MPGDFLKPRAERFGYLPKERIARTSLPWIIALMVVLATLGIAGGIALGSSAAALETSFAGRMTVQVVSADPGALAPRREAVMDALANDPAVASHRLLGDAELEAMLAPWIGEGDLGDTVALPAMIDVELVAGADADAAKARIAKAAPDVIVDLQSDWLAPVARLAWVLTATAIVAALLLAGAMAAVIAIGTRAGLGRHAESIAVLHLIGAEDRSIAELFQYRFAITALAGAVGGFAAAMLLVLLLAALIDDAGRGLLSAASFPAWGWVALCFVPVGAVLLALATSRRTVEHTLAARI